MINTTAMLLQQLHSYVNPAAKIRRMVDKGELFPVIRGLYETNRSVPGHCLAPVIYGPSYLTFEFALAWHDLIPEAVYTYTSATCGKNRKKQYNTPYGLYTYRDVPVSAFPYGVDLHYDTENGYCFAIASPEKAVCDQLYACSPCSNKAELKRLLFQDFRMDDDLFFKTDTDKLSRLAALYRTSNHHILISLIKEVSGHGSHH